MPLYQYEGWDMASRPVKGKRGAASEQALYEVLKAEGIFLTRCMRLDGIGGTQRMLKPIELSEFCRQTAVMTGSGITLSRALGILRTGTEEKRSRFIYGYLQKRMKQGCPMSSAMEEMGIFPEMMINMVRAGESSGKMEQTMTELANHYQKEHQMRTRIQTAVQYPKILCLAAVASVLTIFLVVIPTVEPLFEGMELPLLTKILMGFSDFIKEKWYIAIVLLCLPATIWQTMLSNEKFRCLWDEVKLSLPVVGKQLKIIYTARFSRSQSSLYASGLPMLLCLEIAGRTLGNHYLEKQFSEVIKQVQNGEMLSRAIQNVDGLDKKLASVIFVGEETGKLDKMLESVANGYEYESDMALTRLIGLIEPVMILVMGVIIGIILLGVMVPMWNMYGYIG